MRVTPSTNFIELLEDTMDFLDNCADVDYDDGRAIPNKAMRLYTRVSDALHELEGLNHEAEWPDSRG